MKTFAEENSFKKRTVIRIMNCGLAWQLLPVAVTPSPTFHFSGRAWALCNVRIQYCSHWLVEVASSFHGQPHLHKDSYTKDLLFCLRYNSDTKLLIIFVFLIHAEVELCSNCASLFQARKLLYSNLVPLSRITCSSISVFDDSKCYSQHWSSLSSVHGPKFLLS